MKFFLIIGIFAAFSLFLITGRLLDLEAERVVEQLHQKDSDGVIKNLNSVEVNNGLSKAVILLHGFLDTPEIYFDLIEVLKQTKKMDIYAPLFPFHGRNLKEAVKFNNKDITNFLEQYIKKISRKYEDITILGLSYGGAQLIKLSQKKVLPNKAKVILLAPAIYIKGNTFFGRAAAVGYGFWRQYINYPSLGVDFSVFESGDEYAQNFLENEKNLRYTVISAVKAIYRFDNTLRTYFKNMKTPHTVIVAKNDNKVSYDDLSDGCRNNAHCTLHDFTSGKHLLHLSKHKEEVVKILLDSVHQ